MSIFEDSVNDYYDRFEEMLADSDCDVTASEFQGVLAGMVSAGMQKNDKGWRGKISQLVSQEATLSETINNFAKDLLNETHNAFADDDLLAPILIPDDTYPMIDRLESLSLWSQGYLLGFGIEFGDQQALPKELNESLADIAEISQVSIEKDQSEESKSELETLIEHIKVAVKMIYMELVKKPATQPNKNQTIH